LFAPLNVPNRTTAGSSFGHLIATCKRTCRWKEEAQDAHGAAGVSISSVVTYVGGSQPFKLLLARNGPGCVSETLCYVLNQRRGKLSAQASSYNGQLRHPFLADCSGCIAVVARGTVTVRVARARQ
jgi:hypothetical protein